VLGSIAALCIGSLIGTSFSTKQGKLSPPLMRPPK
jgi:hypothetical protein